MESGPRKMEGRNRLRLAADTHQESAEDVEKLRQEQLARLAERHNISVEELHRFVFERTDERQHGGTVRTITGISNGKSIQARLRQSSDSGAVEYMASVDGRDLPSQAARNLYKYFQAMIWERDAINTEAFRGAYNADQLEVLTGALGDIELAKSFLNDSVALPDGEEAR